MAQGRGLVWPQNHVYHIEFRIRRLREKGQIEDVQAKDRNRLPRVFDRLLNRWLIEMGPALVVGPKEPNKKQPLSNYSTQAVRPVAHTIRIADENRR